MKNFEGGSNLVNVLPEPGRGHRTWTHDTNTASGSLRALRILMPLGMAIDILEHADLNMFVSLGGAVHCKIGQLREPSQPMWFIKTESMDKICVSNVNPEAVHCKVVELPLNYHQVMVRYQFRTPPRGGLTNEKWFDRCSTYLKMWIELLIAEKRRQMHAIAEMWPKVPWYVGGIFAMPIVLWLSKHERNERKRSAAQKLHC